MIMKQDKKFQPQYSRFALTLLLLLGISLSGYSQSIRKSFREMTVSERDALVAALNADGGLFGTSGIINAQATFHASSFSSIHFQNDFNDDVFFAWHRQNSLAVERVMQSMSDWVSLPYWDWTNDADDEDNGPGTILPSPLWTNAWLGGFDAAWGLSRMFHSNQIFPSAAAVNLSLSQSNFQTFSQTTENGSIHTNGHIYTGGTMTTSGSPKDPTFYFHHNMVDKIWQDWEEIHGNSAYTKTSLPGFTSVNPNAIVDSRTIGVFYAENGLAELANYTVANLVLPTEKFVYQFVIEAGNGFEVPSGRTSEFRSCSEIVLKDGFRAHSGSDFVATIDGDCDFSTAFKVDPALAYVDSFNTTILKPEEIIQNVYVLESPQSLVATSSVLRIYPNPANDIASLKIEIPNAAEVSFTVIDAVGRTVKRWNANLEKGVSTLDFDASELSSGLYYLSMNVGDHRITEKMLIQH